MNKQEAIEELKEKSLHHCGEKECYKNGCSRNVELDTAIEIVNQIDDRPKVKIPQFVADWIEKCKATVGDKMFLDFVSTPLEIDVWLDTNKENYEIYMRAWLDGYEVEREKKYKVEFPTGQRLYKNHPNGSSKVAIVIKFAHHAEKDGHFTKRELEEAGFGWVFDCEGVEVEEVEV